MVSKLKYIQVILRLSYITFCYHHHIFPVSTQLEQCRLGPVWSPTGRPRLSRIPSRISRRRIKIGKMRICISTFPKMSSYCTLSRISSSLTDSPVNRTGHSSKWRWVPAQERTLCPHTRGHKVLLYSLHHGAPSSHQQLHHGVGHPFVHHICLYF